MSDKHTKETSEATRSVPAAQQGHTPTPWTLESVVPSKPEHKFEPRAWLSGIDAEYGSVRIADIPDFNPGDSGDAKFIVRAVNSFEQRERDLTALRASHDALLEENRRFEAHNRALIEAAHYATCPSCKHNRCQMLRDAIAQAEGRI